MQEPSVTDIMAEHKRERVALDPYNVKEDYASWDIGVYADSLEVNVLPTEPAVKSFTTLYRRLQ